MYNFHDCVFSFPLFFPILAVIPVPPELVPFPALSQVVHTEGIRTRLLCGLSRGDLPVSFSWLKDDRPIDLSSSSSSPSFSTASNKNSKQQPLSGGDEDYYRRTIEITAVDEFSSLLTFVSLRSAHSGNYTCLAENEAGRAQYTTTITVKGTYYFKKIETYTSSICFAT